MTPKDPFLEGTFWDKFWRPIRSRALLFTPELPWNFITVLSAPLKIYHRHFPHFCSPPKNSVEVWSHMTFSDVLGLSCLIMHCHVIKEKEKQRTRTGKTDPPTPPPTKNVIKQCHCCQKGYRQGKHLGILSEDPFHTNSGN